MSTTTLVFDVLGTLLDEDAGRLAAAREVVGDGAEGFVARWEELSQEATRAMREGRRPYAVAETVSAEAVLAVAAERGERLTEAEVDRLAGAGRHLEPFPEVVDTLDRLAGSYALVALTNAGTAQAHAMSRSAGLRWTTLVSGETVGAYKPDARMYEHVVRTLQLDVGECVFVAAHPWDLDAAARHGFRTAYVDRSHSTAAEMAAFARRFDHVAGDLAALATLLP
ncbi:haloacid dehalogenase type II [Nocardioides sp. 503]|uniref:haloacid dehalogenase type II n=1 Tax=Nocardioides sp. 503 TaxID=2508326 RepID=UPI00106F3B9F|nr:haloacid dehalogenase type II [Nocardioides sp. 503]